MGAHEKLVLESQLHLAVKKRIIVDQLVDGSVVGVGEGTDGAKMTAPIGRESSGIAGMG